MNPEQVVDKILADAKAEADAIMAEAKKQRGALDKELEGEIFDFDQKSSEMASKAGADKKSRILAAARMEIAKQKLSEKRRILDDVFTKAKERISSVSDDEYREWVASLIKQAVETGDEEVVVDPSETRIDQELIKKVNRDLGPGYQGNLKLSDDKEKIGSGFILKRGKIRKNVSVDVLIDQARGDLQIELAKELF